MKYDVIVVGFGTAGAVAAIAAARRGVSVLVLEQTSYPGGLQTGGFISEYYVQQPVGLAAELEAEARALTTSTGDYACAIEPKKRVLEQNAIAAGADLRYEITITDVLVEAGKVTGICWLEDDQEYHASASVVIDATAEADIAFLAGCECVAGRQWDGAYQHSSNIFHCLKRTGEKRAYGYIGKNLRIRQDRILEFSAETLRTTAAMIGNNSGAVQLTVPSDLPGIREGKHIVSRNQLSLERALLERKAVHEPIVYAYSHVDTNISDFALESETFQDWMIVAGMWGTRLWFAIPRNALLPKYPDGILIAGRHWGVDHDAAHALRMNAAMGSIGEAAGIMAAHAAMQKIAPSDVPYSLIAKELDLPPSPLPENDTIWGLTDEEIRTGLESECPGKAIWSAYRNNRRDLLDACFREADLETKTKARAAFALALLREPGVIPCLRSLAEKRDETPICSAVHDAGVGGPTITTRHGYVAVYLLGRFRDTDSISVFTDILDDAGCAQQFEYQSLAIIALLKIGQSSPECRTQIASILRTVAENPDWILKTRFIKYAPPEVRVDATFRSIIARELDRWGFAHQIHNDGNAPAWTSPQ